MPLTLKELLEQARARHGDASGRRLAEIAQANGHEIDRTQINAILGDTYMHRPRRKLLDAIAFLAAKPRDLVFAAAGEPRPRGDFREEIPEDADVLRPEYRQIVISLIKALISVERDLAGREVSSLELVVDVLQGIQKGEIPVSDPLREALIARANAQSERDAGQRGED